MTKGAKMYKAKLLAIVSLLETKAGLRKGELASCKCLGDGLVKIKINPDGEPIKQINWAFHEWTHLVLEIFNARKKNRKLAAKEEEAICNRIGNFVERVFKREFGVRRGNDNKNA